MTHTQAENQPNLPCKHNNACHHRCNDYQYPVAFFRDELYHPDPNKSTENNGRKNGQVESKGPQLDCIPGKNVKWNL